VARGPGGTGGVVERQLSHTAMWRVVCGGQGRSGGARRNGVLDFLPPKWRTGDWFRGGRMGTVFGACARAAIAVAGYLAGGRLGGPVAAAAIPKAAFPEAGQHRCPGYRQRRRAAGGRFCAAAVRRLPAGRRPRPGTAGAGRLAAFPGSWCLRAAAARGGRPGRRPTACCTGEDELVGTAAAKLPPRTGSGVRPPSVPLLQESQPTAAESKDCARLCDLAPGPRGGRARQACSGKKPTGVV